MDELLLHMLERFLAGEGPGMKDAPTKLLSERAEKYNYAWVELERRLRELREDGQPIPGELGSFAADVVIGNVKRPRRSQYEDRDIRIAIAVDVLTDTPQLTERKAVLLVAEKTSLSPEAVYSILRKIRRGQPL